MLWLKLSINPPPCCQYANINRLTYHKQTNIQNIFFFKSKRHEWQTAFNSWYCLEIKVLRSVIIQKNIRCTWSKYTLHSYNIVTSLICLTLTRIKNVSFGITFENLTRQLCYRGSICHRHSRKDFDLKRSSYFNFEVYFANTIRFGIHMNHKKNYFFFFFILMV